MQFLTPIAFFGALFAIPIILLYMLRLRRREVVVSSNFLWQQILRDQEANTPWQRLRRNILLILQLIILALIILALARPAQIVPTLSAGKTVILLDASASMNATDTEGQSRFEAAQTQARLILSEISIDDEVSLIRVADVTEPLISYTNDINALRAAINTAQAGQGSADWDTALTLAAAGAEGAEDFSIIIISDGGIGAAARLPENIPQPIYIAVGEAEDNLAISALATRALAGQQPQLFALVDNYSPQAAEVSLVVRLDGELWDSVTRTVSGSSQRSFIFNVNESFETITAELVYDDAVVDYLAQDDRAHAVAGNDSTRRVLLMSDQSNLFLEQVLRSLPGVQVFRGETGSNNLPAQNYDLYIFNNWLPNVLPDGDMLIINPPQSTSIFSLGSTVQGLRTVRVAERGHPLAAFLRVDNLNVREFRSLSNVNWGTPILTIDEQPLLLAGEEAGRQIVLMPFNLLDSDLPLQIAWPLLMSNALEWFAPANIISGATSLSVGETLRINPPVEADRLRVTLPDGETREIIAEGGEAASFVETDRPGLYQLDVLEAGEITQSQAFAVNLFGAAESQIAPVLAENLAVGGGEVEVTTEAQLGFREFWPLLAGLALLILLYEWYTYFQRLRVPSSAGQNFGRRAS